MTSGTESSLFNFKTHPTKTSEASLNFVAMSDMQRDNSNPDVFETIVDLGVIPNANASYTNGIEALQNVTNKYLSLGKKVTLTHLSPECKTILLKANPTLDKIIESSIEDPRYHVVTDLLDSEV